MAETVTKQPTSTSDEINKEENPIIKFLKTDVRFNSASIPHKYKGKDTNQLVDAAFSNYFYDIQDPAWYPDSFIRSKMKNLYNNMLNTARFALTYSQFKVAKPLTDDGQIGRIKGISDEDANKVENSNKALDFYFSPDNGKIGNIVSSICKSVVSYAYSQVSGVISAAEHGFSLLNNLNNDQTNTSTKKDVTYTPETLFLSTQPMIDVQGIMTDERLIKQLEVANAAVSYFRGIFEKDALDNNKLINFIGGLKNDLETLFKNVILEYFFEKDELLKYQNKSLIEIITALSTRPDLRLHGLAEKVFLTMIYGNYKAHFRIPMSQKDVSFCIANGQDGWTASDNSPQINFFGKVTTVAQELSEINIPNIFMRKKWEQSSVVGSGRTFSCSFYLFNDTLEHFMLNFNYIIHILALCSPITDTALVRPPYLFNLKVPGGLRYLLCSCNCTIKNMGKIRKLGSREYVANILKHITEQFAWIKDLSSDELTYCPDGYQVTLNFKSLIPPTWNFDQAYLTNWNIGIPKEPNQSFLALNTGE